MSSNTNWFKLQIKDNNKVRPEKNEMKKIKQTPKLITKRRINAGPSFYQLILPPHNVTVNRPHR